MAENSYVEETMKYKRFVFIIISVVFLSISCKETEKADYKPVADTFSEEYTESNIYFDKESLEDMELLSVLQPESYEDLSFIYGESRKLALETVRKQYFLALELYNQKEYEKSIDNFILACKDYNCFGIIYYQLGLCLMDAGNYDAAKISFNRAADKSDEMWLDELYSIDANGLRREKYFSYYNIACIESLQNNINASYEYLCKALYHGYPYLDHLKKDADLGNLFSYNNGIFLKSIEEIYNAGSNNMIAGKGYDWQGGNASADYYFMDDSHMMAMFWSVWPDPGGWITAEYEIKNYIIIIKNIQYHYAEEERFKLVKFILYIKDFVSLDSNEIYYKEIPLDGDSHNDLVVVVLDESGRRKEIPINKDFYNDLLLGKYDKRGEK
jgi:tetratricopeptide (TPR) repeat protein